MRSTPSLHGAMALSPVPSTSNPECEVFPVYTGSFDDALKAKQAVDALQQKGVDIVTQNADACGVGAVQECDALGDERGRVSDQTTIGESALSA